MVHAEQNCIYNATFNGVSLENSHLYIYGLPACFECAKGIIQVGIKHVYVLNESLNKSEIWKKSWQESCSMFNEAKVEYTIL